MGCVITFLSIFCLLGLTMTVGFFFGGMFWGRAAVNSSFPACISIIPALITAGGIAMLTSIIRRIARHSNAPIQAIPAIIISIHRRHSSGPAQNISLEFEDGQRQEYFLNDQREVGLVGPGDAGVAFTRLDVLLAFDRVS